MDRRSCQGPPVLSGKRGTGRPCAAGAVRGAGRAAQARTRRRQDGEPGAAASAAAAGARGPSRSSRARLERVSGLGGDMLDMNGLAAHRWRSWQVFVAVFAVALFSIVVFIHRGHVIGLCCTDLFVAALFAAIAVAGLGYQEARRLGAFRRRPRL